MRLLTIIAALAAFAGSAWGEAPLESRARRALDSGEWASAQAMYTVLAERNPSCGQYYGRAAVAAFAAGDSAAASEMAVRAMSHAVPPDSLLAPVRAESYRLGRPSIYPALMDSMASRLPHLRRPMLLRRMKYYMERGDARATIGCATQLLRAIPDDTHLLGILADAYMQAGEEQQGADTYARILALDPANYDALLSLANHYAATGNPEALELFRRAYAVRPTPYVAQQISRLTP